MTDEFAKQFTDQGFKPSRTGRKRKRYVQTKADKECLLDAERFMNNGARDNKLRALAENLEYGGLKDADGDRNM